MITFVLFFSVWKNRIWTFSRTIITKRKQQINTHSFRNELPFEVDVTYFLKIRGDLTEQVSQSCKTTTLIFSALIQGRVCVSWWLTTSLCNGLVNISHRRSSQHLKSGALCGGINATFTVVLWVQSLHTGKELLQQRKSYADESLKLTIVGNSNFKIRVEW